MKEMKAHKTKPTDSQVDCTEFFHSGNEKRDVACLLDMAIDRIEMWDVENSPYNQRLKRCWMKRAQELGAKPSW